ncbi:hypothetical protein F2981_24570 (plasmid) [Sinorhizobium meliloti]|nr:hypothetical protein [Sinorhizobium meliloti]
MHMSEALQLFGAGRESASIGATYTKSSASISRITPSRVQKFDKPCALCGAENVYLDEVVSTTRAAHVRLLRHRPLEDRRAHGHAGAMLAPAAKESRRLQYERRAASESQ